MDTIEINAINNLGQLVNSFLLYKEFKFKPEVRASLEQVQAILSDAEQAQRKRGVSISIEEIINDFFEREVT